jgi:prophage regulatory protein
MQFPRLIKLPDVAAATALRPTSIYQAIKDGTLPPPLKLTTRSSAWVEHEIAAVNQARIAGRSDSEIRRLVAKLVAARTQPTAA